MTATAPFSHIADAAMPVSGSTYNARTVIYDLHTHSTASDGALAPAALIEHARQHGVNVLAITDHDTLDAYAVCEAAHEDMHLVTGIELSSTWNGVGIHVVGLNVDTGNAVLQRGVQVQQSIRFERAREIARRLQRAGLPDMFDEIRNAATGRHIGRPHFAAHLVDIGAVRDTAAAYRKFLGAGKIGDVKSCWPGLDEVVAWLVSAGGTAVLAHPAKYRLTKAKTRRLATDFAEAGGHGLEVVCGPQHDATTKFLAGLAGDLDLAASCGSDFHSPANRWSAPGRFPPLPESVRPVWEQWQTT